MPDPPANPLAPDINTLVSQAVEAKMAPILAERKAADVTRLTAEKTRLLSDYAGLIDESDVNAATSMEALAPLERMARKFQTQNPGIRQGRSPPSAEKPAFDSWAAVFPKEAI